MKIHLDFTKKNDMESYIENTRINLIHSDCIIAFRKIPANTIDLTCTSPPYDNLRLYDKNVVWNDSIWKSCINDLYRITKIGGVVVWIVADATINGSETGTSFKQALWAKQCGFNLHDTMIWEKPSFTATGSLPYRYASVFEYMFIFAKGKVKTFNPIKDRLRRHKNQKKTGNIRQSDGSFRRMSNEGKIYDSKYCQRFNVWKFDTTTGKSEYVWHPAKFPESLVRDHIISWSNPGDLVLDPFMGSGTTGVAAKKLGRNFIGIEIVDKYFNLAKDRINNAI